MKKYTQKLVVKYKKIASQKREYKKLLCAWIFPFSPSLCMWNRTYTWWKNSFKQIFSWNIVLNRKECKEKNNKFNNEEKVWK